ncbi:hypothetical protein C8R45DRAFT_1216411, partial [Mycena sanguinolenta]
DVGAVEIPSSTVTESGTRESRLEISGNPHSEQQDTAHWTIDAAEGVGGRREAIPKLELSFVLDGKPATFQYHQQTTGNQG